MSKENPSKPGKRDPHISEEEHRKRREALQRFWDGAKDPAVST